MKIFYLLLILYSISFAKETQDSVHISVPNTIVYDLDSSKEVIKFDDQTIKELKQNEAFDYSVNTSPDNWWKQFKIWLYHKLKTILEWLFGTEEASAFWDIINKLLPYLAVVGGLFLLGWLFMKVNPDTKLFEKQKTPQIKFTEDEDIIHNQDIQQLIEQALTNQNYRLAIRYYYLSILKKLSDSELIIWEDQKTNTDYYTELPNEEIRNQFRTITKLYDFIWYGNFEINKKYYYQAEKEFRAITKTIQA